MNVVKAMSIPTMGLFAGLALLGPTSLVTAAGPAAAAPAAANAVGVTITTNSVVATARVAYNGNPGSVFIAWGDGATSPGATGTPNGPELIFNHTYSAGNGAAFTASVNVSSGADSVTRTVAITPRYAVTQTQQLFSPLSFCDSLPETETEWHIERHISRGTQYPGYPGPEISPIKEWNFDLHSGNDEPLPPAFYPLTGSEVTYEMTMADPSIWVRYRTVEVDPFFDDEFLTGAAELHPRLGSYDGSVIWTTVFEAGTGIGDCSVEFDSDVTVTLLTPPPPPPPVNVPHIPPPSPPTTEPPPPPCQGNPRNCHPA